MYTFGRRHLDVPKIATIIGYLTLFPENHEQASWYTFVGSESKTAKEMRNPSCGTKMCVAGWASAIFAPPNAVFRDGVSFINEFGEHQTVSSYAQEILGFSDEQAQVLFYSLPNKAIIPALKYLVSNPDASGSVLHRKFMEL